jgi:hypothetical protein
MDAEAAETAGVHCGASEKMWLTLESGQILRGGNAVQMVSPRAVLLTSLITTMSVRENEIPRPNSYPRLRKFFWSAKLVRLIMWQNPQKERRKNGNYNDDRIDPEPKRLYCLVRLT